MTLAAAVSLVLSTGGAAQARETRHLEPTEADLWITRGFTVHPCVPVELSPNVTAVAAEHRDLARGQLIQAIEIYNEVLGRDLFRLGPDTSATWTASDGRNVVEMTAHGDPEGDTSVSRYVSGRGRVVSTGTIDGGRHITDLGVLIDVELNPTGRVISVDTLLHEIGHGLGFHHTIDARSIMSYNFDRASHYPDLHDERRFGPAYLKALRHLLPADCAYATIRQAHDWRKGGPVKANNGENIGSWSVIPWPDHEVIDDWVESNEDIGLSLVDGPGIGDHNNERQEPTRIVICRDDLFADCLGGSALAGEDGAVLFVEGGADGRLDERIRDALWRPGLEILILGGPNAVSAAIEDDIRAHGEALYGAGDPADQWTIERIAGGPGTGRFGTANAIADAMIARGASAEMVLLARADNPVDAVAAGAIAAREQLPILLTPSHELHEVTAQWLAANKPARMVVLGGFVAVQQVVADQADVHVGQVERAWGRNRRATSVGVAEHPWLWGRHTITDSSAFYLLNGQHESTWALALAAAPWAAKANAPILLTEYDHLGMTQRGTDGAADPGWYFWNLDAAQAADHLSDPPPSHGFYVLGSPTGNYSHPFLANTVSLTLNAEQTYRFDGG